MLPSGRLLEGPSVTNPKPPDLNEEQKPSASPAVVELGHYDPPEELEIQLAPLIKYYDQNSPPFLHMQEEMDADFKKYIERDPSWYFRYYTDWKHWHDEREFSTTPRQVDGAKLPASLVDPDGATSTSRPNTVVKVESTGSGGSQWIFVGVAVVVSSIIAFIVSMVTNRMHRPAQLPVVILSVINLAWKTLH